MWWNISKNPRSGPKMYLFTRDELSRDRKEERSSTSLACDGYFWSAAIGGSCRHWFVWWQHIWVKSFFLVGAVMSLVAGQHVQSTATCLSSSRMSKSRRGKMRGRDTVTEVTARVVFSGVLSHIIFFLKHLSLFWGEVKKKRHKSESERNNSV